MMLSLALITPFLAGQNPPDQPLQLIPDGKDLFVTNCAGCHGADARGSDRAPRLAESSRLRALSTHDLNELISRGIPSKGMPAFDLSVYELHAITAFLRSLNAAPPESSAPGSPSAGMQFFFGKAKCGSCHMVDGRGKPVGPDLSVLGRRMTPDEIQAVLLHPGEHITFGYQLVTVRLRDGSSIRGFARGRSNYDIQLQDLQGRFHMIEEGQISAVHDEKGSVMEPLAARAEELQDLIAYLSRLKGVEPVPSGASTVDRRSEAPGIEFSRILNPRPGDWLTYNGNLSGNRYSELTEINATNVARMAVKWVFPIAHFGLEATPIVADGIMYVTGPNEAFALDALSGRPIWQYSRPRTRGLVGDASLGTNRGVAILGDKVFMTTDNAHLIALNRVTGSLVWEAVMPDDPHLPYGSTVAPLVVKDTVIAGVSGGDWGIRGLLACYKASTGKRVWRVWTTPAKGEPGYDTWEGKDPRYGGGATWLTGSYDAETDTLFWSTGNSYPEGYDSGGRADYLFTACVLALNPETGKLKWFFQFNPHDNRGWDANQPSVLVDTPYRGQNRRLLLQADRNGFFYVLDRTDGRALLVEQFVHRQNWASGVGPDGHPQPLAENSRSADGMTCPALATNWSSTAFSPVTRLYYLMTYEECQPLLRSPAGHNPPKQQEEGGKKFLRAIDIDTGKVRWELQQIGLSSDWEVEAKAFPGVLATAGGILFYGDPNGAFAAVDQQHGKPLWHFPTNITMKASPMTYMVGGKQFVAVAAGTNILCFGLP
jgi:PQQ-dependent dehydrogenase (methanol/ethanol family)